MKWYGHWNVNICGIKRQAWCAFLSPSLLCSKSWSSKSTWWLLIANYQHWWLVTRHTKTSSYNFPKCEFEKKCEEMLWEQFLTAKILVKTCFQNTKNCSNRSDIRTCKQYTLIRIHWSVCTRLMVNYQHIFAHGSKQVIKCPCLMKTDTWCCSGSPYNHEGWNTCLTKARKVASILNVAVVASGIIARLQIPHQLLK